MNLCAHLIRDDRIVLLGYYARAVNIGVFRAQVICIHLDDVTLKCENPPELTDPVAVVSKATFFKNWRFDTDGPVQ